ncbi:MAG: peptidoglycan-binding protein [Bradyrhizobium sp.]|nr:peptidoglycan-binding protein [Bradyrhizobium sp.]
MPRRVIDDEDKPRRRRGAAAIAVEADAGRGLVLRILLHSPKDTVAAIVAFVAVVAIIANALFLQASPHPSPMLGSIVTMPAPVQVPNSPLPRPRPTEATRSEAVPEPKVPESRIVETKVAEPRAAEVTRNDPLANLVKATSTVSITASSIPRPPASIPASSHSENTLSPGGSRRVAAVQRVLTAYGYGQLKPTGIVGADTQAAILKFERERKIPATGQMSERFVHELSAMIGRPIN